MQWSIFHSCFIYLFSIAGKINQFMSILLYFKNYGLDGYSLISLDEIKLKSMLK